MNYLKGSSIYIIACQLLCFGFYPTLASFELSLQDKALYISENNCDKLRDSTTGAPILLQASHVALVGRAKMIKETYGHNNGRYSMAVMPQCIQKGNVSEKEIVVRNLGKTKCGASDAEQGKDYLFFLRRTSDPKVFEATNAGAQMVDGPILWTPVFTMFCGIKLIKRCDVCPMGCSYTPPPDGACIPIELTVADTFNVLYPFGIPKTTTAASVNTMREKQQTPETSSTTAFAIIKKMTTESAVFLSKNNKKDDKYVTTQKEGDKTTKETTTATTETSVNTGRMTRRMSGRGFEVMFLPEVKTTLKAVMQISTDTARTTISDKTNESKQPRIKEANNNQNTRPSEGLRVGRVKQDDKTGQDCLRTNLLLILSTLLVVVFFKKQF